MAGKIYTRLIGFALFLPLVASAGNTPPMPVKIQDGSANPITSTLVTGKQAIDVNVVQTVGSGGGGTGDASAANQTTEISRLTSILAKQPALGTAGTPSSDVISVQGVSSGIALPVIGTFWQATQPVSAASLPLPSGASTSAKQDTANTSLSSIDGKLGSLGQKTMTSSAPVVIASDQSTLKVQGVVADGAATTENPVAISGRIGSGPGAGTYTKQAVTTAVVGTDQYGNDQIGLSVFDYASGQLKAESHSFTSGSGDYYPLQANGPNLFLDVSGTWTGSISVVVEGLAGATYTLPVRSAGSSTTVTSITANGSYVLDAANLALVRIVNSVATGALDLYSVAPPRAQTGLYSYQAGTWNLGNITGTVSLPTGAATSAKQDTGNTSVASIDTKTPALGQATMANSRPVVIASNQSAVPVSGTFWQATQPVSGTFWQATQPVSGPLTDTQLRASAVPVSSAQSGTWTVQPGNTANSTAWLMKLDQTTTNNDVDVVSEIPGTGATNLGKAEDAAHTSSDTGVMNLAVRKDTNSQFTNADGDYSPYAVDAYGAQYMRNDHPNRIRCTVTVSTATTIQAVGGSCAAPGAGLSIYVTDIHFDASAAGIAADAFPTLKYGTGGTCGTGTAIFWGKLTAAAVTASESFITPIKIPANNEICWISSTAGSKFLAISGYIAP
jgi:hypothetical protein